MGRARIESGGPRPVRAAAEVRRLDAEVTTQLTMPDAPAARAKSTVAPPLSDPTALSTTGAKAAVLGAELGRFSREGAVLATGRSTVFERIRSPLVRGRIGGL